MWWVGWQKKIRQDTFNLDKTVAKNIRTKTTKRTWLIKTVSLWTWRVFVRTEPSNEVGLYNILADAPGPEEEEEGEEQENEEEEHRARREVFEFELSDRPLLPCYNIQVSLCQR